MPAKEQEEEKRRLLTQGAFVLLLSGRRCWSVSEGGAYEALPELPFEPRKAALGGSAQAPLLLISSKERTCFGPPAGPFEDLDLGRAEVRSLAVGGQALGLSLKVKKGFVSGTELRLFSRTGEQRSSATVLFTAQALAVSPDREAMLWGNRHGRVDLVQAPAFEPVELGSPHEGNVRSMSWAAAGRAASLSKRSVAVWDLRGKAALFRLGALKSKSDQVALSRDGRLLLVRSNQRVLGWRLPELGD